MGNEFLGLYRNWMCLCEIERRVVVSLLETPRRECFFFSSLFLGFSISSQCFSNCFWLVLAQTLVFTRFVLSFFQDSAILVTPMSEFSFALIVLEFSSFYLSRFFFRSPFSHSPFLKLTHSVMMIIYYSYSVHTLFCFSLSL